MRLRDGEKLYRGLTRIVADQEKPKSSPRRRGGTENSGKESDLMNTDDTDQEGDRVSECDLVIG